MKTIIDNAADTGELDPRIQQAIAQIEAVYQILPEFVPYAR